MPPQRRWKRRQGGAPQSCPSIWKGIQMITNILLVTLSFLWGGLPAQAQPRSEDEGRPQRLNRTETGDSDTDEARRARRRERWQRFRGASSEERRQMRSERMVEMATRTYELDETQKELVRSELELIGVERRVAMGDQAEEYDKLREEMSKFWQQRQEQAGERAGGRGDRREFWRGLRDDPEFSKLRSRMREIDQKYPFSWRDSLKRVESLLPEEQAAKGRARLDERFQRFGRSRQDRRDRRADREQRSVERTLREAETAMREAGSPEQRETAQRLLADARTKIAERSLSEDARRSLQERVEAAERTATEKNPKPRSLGPWEKYVQGFIGNHALTPAQQTAAMAILKDMQARRAQIERVYAPRIAAAEQLKDPKARKQRLAELNKPTEKLFEELKTRLDRLLTASQRKEVKV